jgi:hypothetical protein
MLGRAHRSSVRDGFGAARFVAAPVAEDLAGEDDDMVVPGAEVDVPAELGRQRAGERLRESGDVVAVRLSLDERPHLRLPVGRTRRQVHPADLAQAQSGRFEGGAGAEALADEVSADHVR